jgi:hypothetical protein
MPLNLAALADKKADLKFDFAGDVVRIEYYPHKVTPNYMARLQALGSAPESDDDEDGPAKEDAPNADAKMVSEILVGWDVVGHNDEPYPPTYENLLAAPQALVSRVAMEIVAALGKLAQPKTSRK